MKSLKPSYLLVFGAVIVLLGLIYHVNWGGLPYQDPTPEVYASWRLHSRIGDTITLAGLGIFLIGLLWLIMGWRVARIKKQRADEHA